MRFAIYHPWVYLTSGLERSLLELVRRSRHDWVVLTHHYSLETTYPGFAEVEVVELEPRVSVQRSLGPLVHASRTLLGARLPVAGCSGLLVSSEGLGDFVMRRNRLPTACYCHTPLKIVHDPATRATLVRDDKRKAAALALLSPAFQLVDRAMWRRFDHVLVNSRETRERVERARLWPAGRAEVLHPGVDLDAFPPGPVDRGPQLLVAGRIMWQKRVDLAIKALRLVTDRFPQAQLVVAGAVDEKSRPLLVELRQQATGLPVRFEVDPTDERLAELYRTSRVLVFTAPNEDWGMVPLEAMASGTPVLAVDGGGPRESVVNGVTGWLRPPRAEAFAEVLAQVLDDPALPASFHRACVDRASAYSWDAFARRVDDVMEGLAGARPPGQ